MSMEHGHILVVDDNALNRKLLERALVEQGHAVQTAQNGREALEKLRAGLHPQTHLISPERKPFPQVQTVPLSSRNSGELGGTQGKSGDSENNGHTWECSFDIVLLDIMMPEMDGFETLAQIKGDPGLRHVPVIMISALDEMDGVLRSIEMGATDYLPKPFDPRLLNARINASLAGKRLRDLELEYLVQVGYVTAAAAAVEAGQFEPESLDRVAKREDALGQLARVFQRMGLEVRVREERLKQQVQELRIEIDEARKAREVSEITESDYFKQLRDQAERLRGRGG